MGSVGALYRNNGKRNLNKNWDIAWQHCWLWIPTSNWEETEYPPNAHQSLAPMAGVVHIAHTLQHCIHSYSILQESFCLGLFWGICFVQYGILRSWQPAIKAWIQCCSDTLDPCPGHKLDAPYDVCRPLFPFELGWLGHVCSVIVGAHIVKYLLLYFLPSNSWSKPLPRTKYSSMLEVVKVRSRTLSSLVAEYLVGGFMWWWYCPVLCNLEIKSILFCYPCNSAHDELHSKILVCVR